MQLKPGSCYRINAHAIARLQSFGNYEFIVTVIHANDTSDSVVFEFRKIIGKASRLQEIATRQIVEMHADGASLEDITGASLNLEPFEKESAFQQWIATGVATLCDCNA